MALNANVASTWKELTAHGRADAWKDIVEGFQNVEGVWTVIYSSGALIGFSDYPYPIPVMAGWQYRVGDTGDWVKVTEDGEINTSGTFTGVVKASKTLSLNEWYSEESVEYGDMIKNTGTSLVSLANSTSFVNGEKGYVCGGSDVSSTNPHREYVTVFDSSGNVTLGTSLSRACVSSTSFVNANKGYVCGGYQYWYNSNTSSAINTYFTVVDVYDTSGNRTTGTALSVGRSNLTSFVNGDKGYVCGGTIRNSGDNPYSDAVDVYDSSGNRTTGTSLSDVKADLTSFVNGDKGYVCGGMKKVYLSYPPGASEYRNVEVDVYDLSGNRTTGTSLSSIRVSLTSFVNGDKGYVCGGSGTDIVEIYDLSGNKTSGTALSVGRGNLTSFVIANKGYVCGGIGNSEVATVDIYDLFGNRTTGEPLSVARYGSTSFVNAKKGYVCGGGANNLGTVYNTVDIYYMEEIPTYETNLPITAGTSYTLNGITGVAETSEVLHFDDKVTGTIKYKDGDLYPSLDITVYDKDGSVAVGADIVIEDLTCVATLILRDEDGTVLTGIDINIEKVE